MISAYQKTEGIRFVKEMGVGWNLGNSLDVYRMAETDKSVSTYETYWGNPVTTKEIIDTVSNAGFETIRIPVSWGEHMDENGIVDSKWMARVTEVVDYGVANDMYIILNTHHEEWLTTAGNQDVIKKKLSVLWTQIAENFARYDEKLLFEGINEPRDRDGQNEWKGNPEAYKIVNDWNMLFIDTVRNTGGNNELRYLLISPYAGSTDLEVLEELMLPKDSKIIVTVHLYKPYEFAMVEEGSKTWTEDMKQIQDIFKRLKHIFIQKKIPIIIGEFGCVDKGNIHERTAWADYYRELSENNNMALVWWDDGGIPENKLDYALLNRYTQKWIYPEIVEILTR